MADDKTTLTQADVDRIVSERLAREQRNHEEALATALTNAKMENDKRLRELLGDESLDDAAAALKKLRTEQQTAEQRAQQEAEAARKRAEEAEAAVKAAEAKAKDAETKQARAEAIAKHQLPAELQKLVPAILPEGFDSFDAFVEKEMKPLADKLANTAKGTITDPGHTEDAEKKRLAELHERGKTDPEAQREYIKLREALIRKRREGK